MNSHQQLHDKILHLIDHAKKLGTDQAEASISVALGFEVTARMGDVETVEQHQEKNLQITVYQEHRRGSASTSDLSIDAIMAALHKACAIAKYAESDACLGLADAEKMAVHYPDLQLSHPWSITPEQAIDSAIHCDNVARDQDARIKNSEGASVSTNSDYYVYANSHGFLGDFSSSEHSISCSVIAETNGDMQRDYEYTIARNANDLQTIDWVAKNAASKALARLGAQKISTRQCPVIFHSNVARSLWGHFVAAISGYNLYRRTSFLCDHLHKPVFPDFVTIYQDPHLLGDIGSQPFDDEGVATQKIEYIKNGLLRNYVLGSYSARKLGLQTTGNAGGVFNLCIQSSDHSVDFNLSQLLREMGTGLLLTELIGQGVNLMTGDYSRGAFGFWVENGEIQYPVHEITVAGNLQELFRGVQLIGNDIDRRGNIKTGSVLLDRMTIAGD